MCVIGLVTLMLRSPATHNKKPKTPVTRVPHRKTEKSQVASLLNLSQTLRSSPSNTTNGRSRMAEPTFVHHANSMVELLQYGRELLIRTA